ncbi:hypothetical protein L198_07526 [Cryptococcus wingfieldii CBS 7118]|uniref:Copper-fist domain-containing protein n=1 Tax=Cryptococcus wingfieldii CBS 7118 TaxID=1295528 RepID=A0A1E3IAK6_9TREE|nr:hypothetical protein L198_07526 [Cryptococcus wingfieldii CBS 7118]ODN85445.1 hypothetical protein L198_07526 [Cryptococcus wingfieldii CBS 7118]
MVLINEKKYACERCIKGHRVSSCTHTDRALFEIKKKGRPGTQCKHCKEKRKSVGSSVHTKCKCGSSNPLACEDTSAEGSTAPAAEPEVETRKGQPGSRPAFPRGLKDVHELSAAANALQGLGEDDAVVKSAERTVQALLNPCRCDYGGPCSCCEPKRRSRKQSPPSTGTGTLIASTAPSPIDTIIASYPTEAYSKLSPTSYLNPDNPQRASNKTRLYSPYTTDPRGRRDSPSNSVGSTSSPSGWNSPRSVRPPPTRVKPLTDIKRFLTAAMNKDGSLASEIPRSVLGLPGIQTFDAAAKGELVTGGGGACCGGGGGDDPSEDVDMALAFPTLEDVVLGACMCGEDCSCPGCATHDTTNTSNGETGHDGPCGEPCQGHHNCSSSIPIPSGVQSIAQLVVLAAAQVPKPPSRPVGSFIDPLDTRVLPPAAFSSDEAARKLGLVPLRPLECCGGKCQCPPGQCTCQKQCCGCCGECSCDKDEDTHMGGDQEAEVTEGQGACCGAGKGTTAELIPKEVPEPLAPTSSTKAAIANITYHPTMRHAMMQSAQIQASAQRSIDPYPPSPVTASAPRPAQSGCCSSKAQLPKPPALPKRASDSGILSHTASPRASSGLGRSGSLSSGNRRETGQRKIAPLPVAQTLEARPNKQRAMQPAQPKLYAGTAANPSTAAVPAIPANIEKENQALLEFIEKQWQSAPEDEFTLTSGLDGSGAIQKEGMAMPISFSAEPWAYPPQKEDDENQHGQATQLLEAGADQMDLDAFLRSIGAQYAGQSEVGTAPVAQAQIPSQARSDVPSIEQYGFGSPDFFFTPGQTYPQPPGNVTEESYPQSSQMQHHTMMPAIAPPKVSDGERPEAQSRATAPPYTYLWNTFMGQMPLETEGSGQGLEAAQMQQYKGKEKALSVGVSNGDGQGGRDMVDLSKPIDAAVYQRILQALEKQQLQPSLSTPNAPHHGGSRAQPPPQLARRPASRPSFSARPRSAPKPFYQSSASPQQTFPPAHSPSLNSPYATDAVAKELDDMFSQFVTLDGVVNTGQEGGSGHLEGLGGSAGLGMGMIGGGLDFVEDNEMGFSQPSRLPDWSGPGDSAGSTGPKESPENIRRGWEMMGFGGNGNIGWDKARVWGN